MKVSNKNVFFIRHNNPECKDHIGEWIDTLCDHNRIGLFFENLPFAEIYKSSGEVDTDRIDKINYSSGTRKQYITSLKYFHEIAKEGAYLFVEYSNGKLPGNRYGCLLCEIKPNQSIKKNDDVEITLGYKIIKEIQYFNYPVLLAIRPPFTTICIPQRGTWAEVCKALVTKYQPPVLLKLMHPTMCEQMCEEYLRLHGVECDGGFDILEYCTLKTGGSLAVADIVGKSQQGISIFAQVKNSKISDKAKSSFINACQNLPQGHNIIFSHDPDEVIAGTNVRIINVQKVFEYFALGGRKQMLIDMIGINVH